MEHSCERPWCGPFRPPVCQPEGWEVGKPHDSNLRRAVNPDCSAWTNGYCLPLMSGGDTGSIDESLLRVGVVAHIRRIVRGQPHNQRHRYAQVDASKQKSPAPVHAPSLPEEMADV